MKKTIALVAFAALLAACGPGDYSDTERTNFMDSCIGNGGNVPEITKICECTWDRIVETMPYDEFIALDKAFLDGSATEQDYEKLTKITTACVLKPQ